MCEDYDLCEDCEAKPREDVHNIEHIFIKMKKPRTSSATGRRVLHEVCNALSQLLGGSLD